MDALYEELDLEELRLECSNRGIAFVPKDGRRNLISRLRVFDKVAARDELLPNDPNLQAQAENNDSNFKGDNSVDTLSFGQQLELLQLQREMRREEEERQFREEERQIREEERIRRMKQEEEEREIRKHERLLRMRREEEEIRIRESERQSRLEKEKDEFTDRKEYTFSKPTFIKIREMRENEDIEDYFRIFEMTARAQLVPEREWLGSLVPKLSEKAKAIYLEIPEDEAQVFGATKEIILAAYQHTVDYYRYKFRNSEKFLDEDFVQWNNRSRRYLDRWMKVARAKGSVERILEQIMIEKMLDSVSPELRSWLIEKKPQTSGELAKMANEHIQAKKGPIVDGKYVGHGRKAAQVKVKPSTLEQTEEKKATTAAITPPTQARYQSRRGKDGTQQP